MIPPQCPCTPPPGPDSETSCARLPITSPGRAGGPELVGSPEKGQGHQAEVTMRQDKYWCADVSKLPLPPPTQVLASPTWFLSRHLHSPCIPSVVWGPRRVCIHEGTRLGLCEAEVRESGCGEGEEIQGRGLGRVVFEEFLGKSGWQKWRGTNNVWENWMGKISFLKGMFSSIPFWCVRKEWIF